MNNDREVAQPFILHFTFTVYSLPLTFWGLAGLLIVTVTSQKPAFAGHILAFRFQSGERQIINLGNFYFMFLGSRKRKAGPELELSKRWQMFFGGLREDQRCSSRRFREEDKEQAAEWRYTETRNACNQR